MRRLAILLAALALAGCSAFQTALTWPHDAGPAAAQSDAGTAADAATSAPDAGCPACALDFASVGECCLR